MKKSLLIALSLIAIATLLGGCATCESRKFASDSGFYTVFNACEGAARDCGYKINSSNSSDGYITASQACVGSDRSILVNIQVLRRSEGCAVQINIMPPFGSINFGDKPVERFTAAIKYRVSDVTVTSN